MRQSPFSLKDKTVLVTGASSGIGKACAVMAAQLGAKVVISGRDNVRLEEVYTSLHGDGHQLIQWDLLDHDATTRHLQSLPQIDGLVYAAGVAQVMPFRMISNQHINQTMEINFQAPILLTQMLLKAKKINTNSSLVYITAVADHIAPVGTAVYAASKAALVSAVRSLALEGAKQNIRANCVSPGYVNTPMFAKLTTTTSIDNLLKLSPLGMIEPEDVAASVVYLLSPASKWVTRTTLVVDAGITIPVR